MSLVGAPRVIFLDEPTTGLDPRSRHTMWGIVRDLVAQGTTIFLTTQYLDEADQLAQRIAVLDHGRIVAEGTPSELKRLVPGGHVRLRFTTVTALDHAAGRLADATRDDEQLTLDIPSDGGVESVKDVLNQLESVDVASFSVRTPDLDDVFFALTGRQEVAEVRR
jgi:ABC-2 type transport system ATP-binding protein